MVKIKFDYHIICDDGERVREYDVEINADTVTQAVSETIRYVKDEVDSEAHVTTVNVYID